MLPPQVVLVGGDWTSKLYEILRRPILSPEKQRFPQASRINCTFNFLAIGGLVGVLTHLTLVPKVMKLSINPEDLVHMHLPICPADTCRIGDSEESVRTLSTTCRFDRG
jgi:hypothetical protein